MTSTRTPRPRRRALLLVLPVIVAGLVAFLSAPASGQETAPGWARIGHFSPSQGPVDLLIDGQAVAQGVSFREVSDYTSVPAGTHQFEVRKAGAPADAAPLVDVQAGVPAGGAVTVAAVASRDGLAGQVYDDALMAPAPGQALVRFIHASPEVAAVDVGVVDGPELASDVAYPTASAYASIAAGTYDVTVRSSADGAEIIRVADWTAAAGSQSTVVVVEGLDGQPDVVPILDAGGTGTAPVGGLATGLGGLADTGSDAGHPGSTLAVAGAWAAGAALLALVLTRRARSGATRHPAAVLALSGMAGLVLAGCGSSRGEATGTASGAGTAVREAPVASPPEPSPPAAPSSTPAAGAPTRSGTNVNAPDAVGAPTAVVIPAIGVSSELLSLGVAADGTAEVPADPQLAGWFTGGPRPGEAGPAVISGHVDTKDGPAVFAHLSDLAPGDEVEVRTDDSATHFVVDRTDQVAKDAFPTDEVYGPAPGHQLRLITCGGEFDRSTGHYVDNVVVYLRQVSR